MGGTFNHLFCSSGHERQKGPCQRQQTSAITEKPKMFRFGYFLASGKVSAGAVGAPRECRSWHTVPLIPFSRGAQTVSLFFSRLPHTQKVGRQHSALCWLQVAVIGRQSPWDDRFIRLIAMDHHKSQPYMRNLVFMKTKRLKFSYCLKGEISL